MDKDKILEQLKEFLRIPSVSAQSEHIGDINRCATWLKEHMESVGLEHAQILPTGGHPVVYADWLHAEGKPTFLIYGHYDVQAPDPLDLWTSPPFEPTIRDGNIYARGSADDKGQVFTHIKAIEQVLKEKSKLPVNIKFIIEGEEELGSIHLDDFVMTHKDLLKADVCLISDSPAMSPQQPLLGYGLRGLVYTQVDFSALVKDVHSGSYGGNVANVAIELANVIAKLKDNSTQQVLIPGFYDNVRVLSDEERIALQNSQMNEAFMLKTSGAKKLVGVAGFSPAERMGARPTLDINGMSSGYIAEGSKTIIPARAMAKISMRLVPNQTGAEIAEKLKSYLKTIVPDYIDYEVKILSTGEPILMDISSNYFRIAEQVMTQTFGNKPVYELGGGSIPVTAIFKKVLNIDSVMLGFGLPDDGLHSPNEKLSLEMFWKGIETSRQYIMAF